MIQKIYSNIGKKKQIFYHNLTTDSDIDYVFMIIKQKISTTNSKLEMFNQIQSIKVK